MNSRYHWTMPTGHPAFAGHFPGSPIVPGVVLLDAVLHVIATARDHELVCCRINTVKFLSPVGPGERLLIACEGAETDAIRFTISAGERQVATGVVAVETSA